MPFMSVVPDTLAAAATSAAGIGSSLGDANLLATIPTTGVLAAAGDQVSVAVASLFSAHARHYQAPPSSTRAVPASRGSTSRSRRVA